MIALETTYKKEPIPGLRTLVDQAVRRRINTLVNSSNGLDFRQGNQITEYYNAMSVEEVYALCPFSALLDSFPGVRDWTKLGDFGRELGKHTINMKEMNIWGQNIVDHIRKELWPKSSPVSHLMGGS